jgi:hypothetical protein
MNTNSNTLSNVNSILNSDIKNKGFAFLDSIFKQYGWHLVKNENNWICYTKAGNETDIFDIKITEKAINVSVPVKNSPFQYITTFKDYFSASEYIESRFYDFINKKIECK